MTTNKSNETFPNAPELAIGAYDYLGAPGKTRKGGRIWRGFIPNELPDSRRCRYFYDGKLLRLGWEQYDTDQDAPYFGTWVHVKRRLTFTYCEGDIDLTESPTPEAFRQELAEMAECYGAAPPIMISYGDDGAGNAVRTAHYADRPTG